MALLSAVCCCCLKDLKDFMRQAGEITYADAHKQRVGEGYEYIHSYIDRVLHGHCNYEALNL